jgi:hypothetical protein
MLAVLESARLVARREEGDWLLARSASGSAGGNRAPVCVGCSPAGACLPFGAGSRVDAQWRNLLISLDAATAIPLSALESGSDVPRL